VALELSDPPEGISIQKLSPAAQGTEIILQSDPSKAKAGLKGNLIVYAFSERPLADRAKAAPNRQRTPITALPAIPFEIVEKLADP
jgi:hypothetical protein